MIAVRSLLAAGLAFALSQIPASAETLRLTVFPGISNMAIFAAQHNHFLDRYGLTLDITNTANSGDLREGLADGRFDIAHAIVDNAVALVDGGNKDIAVVMGGHPGFSRLFAQPEIGRIEDIKGKIVAVDAPDTASALVIYKILQDRGINRGDYEVKEVGATGLVLNGMLNDKSLAAAILGPPFSLRALRGGLKDLGATSALIGAYQSDTAFVRRSWAAANRQTLVNYIKAYVAGVRWSLDPANRTEAIALLESRLKLSHADAEETYAFLADPKTGLARDAALNLEGFKNVLAIRRAVTKDGRKDDAESYVDLSYYIEALKN